MLPSTDDDRNDTFALIGRLAREGAGARAYTVDKGIFVISVIRVVSALGILDPKLFVSPNSHVISVP